MIHVENLVKKYGPVTAVDGITFEVRAGEIFGFLGPNGAGKTTTINILCTLAKPTAGRASLAGIDVTEKPDEVRQNIGIIFQDPSLDEKLSAMDNMVFHSYLYSVPREVRKERIERFLRMVGLYERRNDVVKTYSGGMKRRLEIARGLVHEPKVLFLDEPTIGLDPQTRAHIWQHLQTAQRKNNTTIFLTTHHMEEAEICNRIAIIDNGKIVALDTPDNLKKEIGGEGAHIRLEDVFLKLTGRKLRDHDDAPEPMESMWGRGRS